ncbi:protein disulfide oxidoreductase [Kingella kingae]|uniref:protein disulfide oxidoreductase n=1 Tax=Kingella kingae TaxID=504 RepID=UPI00066626C1|nr:protein disulfide oxidoreductase [Kingella kingae]
MKTKLIYWAKQIAQTLFMLLIISVAIDYWRKPSVPMNAANAPFTTLQQTQSTLAKSSDNQTLVLYFWGSWCGICKHTSPVINDLHADGVPVLGVALRSGSLHNVGDYLQQNHLAFDTINDEHGELSQAWGIKVTPTIVLIRNGKVVHSTTGLASYWGLKARIALANVLN